LIPRLTDSLRDKIINPAKGLLIFNTTTNCLNIRRENYWSEICGEPTICCYKWPYKVDVIVNNSGNSNVLTDHQVCVTINHSSLVLSGKSNASGSDFFVADKNCKPLNFWVNPTTLNTSSCEIWVKVPYIQASSSNGASFSIYYGNLSATPKSNGDSTFIFYDDFNNINDGNPPNSLKWAWKGITPTVTNGRLRVRNLIAQKPVGPAHVIEGDVICTATAGNHDFRVNVLISTPDPNLYNTTGYYYYQYLIPWEGGDSRIDRFTNGAAGCNPCLTPCSPNNTGGPKYTNYAFRIITYSPGPSQLQSLEAYNITNNVILKSISCTHQAHGDYFGFSAPDDSRSSTVDNVRVRKWANPQPSVTVSPEILNFIP
ncbi:MAG TPA: DUF2341 domain-containing protein, partial [Bacteroidales bacterium]|nr:DUF2341 domain-containing protein [Bacteroidales bacterium]